MSTRISTAAFDRLARRVERRASNVPDAPAKPGDAGDRVRDLQRALASVGVLDGKPSGAFDAKTRKALEAFQRERSLPVTGTYDAETRKALRFRYTAPLRKEGPRLEVGSRGSAVRKVEKALVEAGLLKGKADGFFDSKTAAAVKRVEVARGWKADGEVGLRDWKALTARSLKLGDVPNAGDTGSAGGNDASGPRKTGSFTTVNLNIKNNPPMSRERLMHDVRKAAAAGDLIGWNEIAPKSYFDGIRALGKDWAHFMPKTGTVQVPISWKKSVFKKVDDGLIRTHFGRPGISPNRYLSWVKLEHRETGQTIVRINTHTVAGAFSAKPQKDRAWRKEHWFEHMKQLRTLVARFEAKGENVIIGGDFNRNHFKVLGDKVGGKKVHYDNDIRVGTHGGATLDYMMHVGDGSLKTVRGRVDKGYHSDHDAVVVKYRLKGKK